MPSETTQCFASQVDSGEASRGLATISASVIRACPLPTLGVLPSDLFSPNHVVTFVCLASSPLRLVGCGKVRGQLEDKNDIRSVEYQKGRAEFVCSHGQVALHLEVTSPSGCTFREFASMQLLYRYRLVYRINFQPLSLCPRLLCIVSLV